MSRDRAPGDGTANGGGDGIVIEAIEPEPDRAYEQLVNLVATLEGVDQDELPPLYTCIDDMVGKLYGDPPPSDANVELAFRYGGYRIEMDQTGAVVLQDLDGH